MGYSPRFGMTVRDAGLAVRANASDCRHKPTPVESLLGEKVAALCGVCLIELPTSWLTPTPPSGSAGVPPLQPDAAIAIDWRFQ